MPSYRATLSYKGTRFQGWQIQPTGLTVQGELNRALASVSKTTEVRTIGSGRTDAGVHARGQVVRMDTPLVIAPGNLLKALNTFLPPDIRVVDCAESLETFQPTFDAESKWYSYFFIQHPYPDPLVGDLVASYGFALNEGLMREACRRFVGRHDFVNFYTEGTEVSSTVRTIHSCELHRVSAGELPFPYHGPVFEIRIHGEGFLKQMVRLMVGAIWSVGRGKIAPDEITRALASARRERLGATAPAEGLYLMRVVYASN